MPFVQGKCESCGGILVVDPSLKAANCPFCGCAYVVQDSINYYNTTIKVETMHADVVNVSDESSSEGRLKAGDAYMKLGQYNKAESEYKKVTEMTPQNPKGWLGMIEASTLNYSKRLKTKKDFKLLKNYADSVKTFVSEDLSKQLLKKYEKYISKETAKNNDAINKLNNAISEQTYNWNELDKQQKSATTILNQKQDRINTLRKNNHAYETSSLTSTLLIIFLVLLIFGLIFLLLGWLMFLGGNIITVALFLIVGVAFCFFASVPAFILIKRKTNNTRALTELQELNNEYSELYNQINEIKKQKNALYLAIQKNKKYICEYN